MGEKKHHKKIKINKNKKKPKAFFFFKILALLAINTVMLGFQAEYQCSPFSTILFN